MGEDKPAAKEQKWHESVLSIKQVDSIEFKSQQEQSCIIGYVLKIAVKDSLTFLCITSSSFYVWGFWRPWAAAWTAL